MWSQGQNDSHSPLSSTSLLMETLNKSLSSMLAPTLPGLLSQNTQLRLRRKLQRKTCPAETWVPSGNTTRSADCLRITYFLHSAIIFEKSLLEDRVKKRKKFLASLARAYRSLQLCPSQLQWGGFLHSHLAFHQRGPEAQGPAVPDVHH